MARVIGIGGVFFKSKDPKALCQWYGEHLGLSLDPSFDGAVLQAAALPRGAYTVWSPFPESTKYFEPAKNPFMVNLIVDDVDAALEQARRGGAEIVGEPQTIEFGRFGWFMDPDGNKVELWKPAESSEAT